jgi:electron transfer flavoprotein beta subunit
VHIAVCIKQIPDPEIAPSLFRVDEEARQVIAIPGMSPVISPFDEQAMEAALKIRDAMGGGAEVRITALTIGEESARGIVKHVLALGADDAVMMSDSAFAESDSYSTAYALSKAIGRLGAVDLVLCGRQAADLDAGVVGPGLAELLGVPAITFARKIDVINGTVRVVRVLGDGSETVEAPLPAVVTVAHELGNVRNASLRETMRAAKKPVEAWAPADIDVAAGDVGAGGARGSVERLYVPVKDSTCEFVDGEGPQAIAGALVRRLVEEKIL